jgi:type IX secretion system PorP/SprF family membrane protein
MKKCILFFILVGITAFSMAQDPLFTQKTGNINHFNPALVGAQSDFGVQLNYRNQWPSFPNNPQNYSLLTNYNLKNGVGFGLDLGHENFGLYKSNIVKINTNYSKTFGEVETRYGLNLGFGQNSINLNALRFEDQIDPGTGFVRPTAEPFESDPKYYFTIDLGAAAYYKGFLLGLGVQQVNQPNTSVIEIPGSELPSRFVANLGYIKEFNTLYLGGMVTVQHQDVTSMIETQVYSQYKFMKLGIGHRQVFGTYGNTDLFSVALGIQFYKFSVGYSYDDDFSNISRASSPGTHQATAAWYIKGLNIERGMSRLMNVIM